MQNIIILKSPLKIIKAYLCPCKIPGTQQYPDCVRRTNSNGDMILSSKDLESGKYFISEEEVIVIEDGKTFNLDDEIERAQWEAIKHHKCIAKSRDQRNEKGELVIDGSLNSHGIADWYVEVPGRAATQKNTTRRLRIDAQTHIAQDDVKGRLLKTRLLGKNLTGAHESDVEDYLMQEAERNPQKIIDIYTGGDMQLRLLFLTAKDENIIIYKDKIWQYGNTPLGSTEDAVISWMKQPKNKKLFQTLSQEVHPEDHQQ